MNWSAEPVSIPEDSEETVPKPLLSQDELRCLFAAAAVTGKMPSEFLRDTVMAAVDETLASLAEEDGDEEQSSTDARVGELSTALAATVDPLDEVAALARTTPVRFELNEEERRRFTELLLDPPEPNEYLKAAWADYQATLAALRSRRSTG
jgi:uncharacterized protein (DUF1778 family)